MPETSAAATETVAKDAGDIERIRARILAAHQKEGVTVGATYAPWSHDKVFWGAQRAILGHSLVDIVRCWELWNLVEEAAKIDGDIIEVGVWRGGTGCLMATRAQMLSKQCEVFLCDTFTGVVKSGPEDTYHDGMHSDTGIETVQALLAKNGVTNCRILTGIFPDETGHTIADRRFSLCHIDVDVYESARSVFNWVWPRMPRGGIVVFDDYGSASTTGITMLCDELRSGSDRVFIQNVNGHAVFVKTS